MSYIIVFEHGFATANSISAQAGEKSLKDSGLIAPSHKEYEKVEITFEYEPSERDFSFLEQKLFDFNCSKVDRYSYENLTIKAIMADSIIGGIQVQIGGGWLYIASLWVDENHRGKGIGKRLLNLAEKTASEKGCHGVYLYTYSFQSPRFYEKSGYSIFGQLEEFCGTHAKYFMKKSLV